jgi:hypothetical protein
MTVALNPDNTCRLDVVELLKSGFQEYAFLRISFMSWAISLPGGSSGRPAPSVDLADDCGRFRRSVTSARARI